MLLNEDIRASEVRCVGDDGTAYGVIPRVEALKIAEKMGLDLVLIAPDAKPPVCKIMDYGKFRYQQEKKQKEAKKKQKRSSSPSKSLKTTSTIKSSMRLNF